MLRTQYSECVDVPAAVLPTPENRGTCPSCGSAYVCVKSVFSFRCADCGRCWTRTGESREAQAERVANENRPSCPECGAANPISRGVRWHCRVCGREWIKHSRIGQWEKHLKELAARISAENRPPCPKCAASNPISKGKRWSCTKCGREWYKHTRGNK